MFLAASKPSFIVSFNSSQHLIERLESRQPKYINSEMKTRWCHLEETRPVKCEDVGKKAARLPRKKHSQHAKPNKQSCEAACPLGAQNLSTVTAHIIRTSSSTLRDVKDVRRSLHTHTEITDGHPALKASLHSFRGSAGWMKRAGTMPNWLGDLKGGRGCSVLVGKEKRGECSK